MKTFACVNDGLVTNVIAAEKDADVEVLKIFLPNEDMIISVDDSTGLAFMGHKWFAELNKFQPLQPYASWTWSDEDFSWLCPVAKPEDGKLYSWSEKDQSWEEFILIEE